jgi:Rrf2 family protein
MLRLSKRVEYGLLAMQDMARRPDTVVSAKDVAERYAISQSLLAKVLQQLARAGVVRSYAGVNGGYVLALDPTTVSIEQVITAIEGSSAALVDCQDTEDHDCAAHEHCTIKGPLAILQERINATFRSMSLAELASPRHYVQLEVL